MKYIQFFAIAIFLCSKAHAMTYTFDCFTNNNAGNCAGTDSVFSFSVEEAVIGQATFTIKHSDSLLPLDTGEITEVYFDGATTQLGSYISSDPMWNEVTNPSNLPGQNNAMPPFVTDFRLDSDFTGQTPDAPIVAGGELDIIFSLLGGTNFIDLIDAINNGDLRLGLHVRTIDLGTGDSSESFVSAVPVPAAVWMFGTGLLAMIGFSRRRLTG